MSGHSEWAVTKHKKAANDAKRAKEWAKMIKNIEITARTGDGDPAGNPALDDVIKKAEKASVPSDNIEHVHKHGSGERSGGADWETIIYEDYAPGGVALIVECLTDNCNHTASDVRSAFNKNSSNMIDNDTVTYLFEKKGVVELPRGELTEDNLLMAVPDAGAEEVNDLGEKFKVVSVFTDLMNVRTALIGARMEYDSADQDYHTSTTVALDADDARKLFRLIDALEEFNGMQNVYSNIDISDEVIAELDDQAFAWRRFR